MRELEEQLSGKWNGALAKRVVKAAGSADAPFVALVVRPSARGAPLRTVIAPDKSAEKARRQVTLEQITASGGRWPADGGLAPDRIPAKRLARLCPSAPELIV